MVNIKFLLSDWSRKELEAVHPSNWKDCQLNLKGSGWIQFNLRIPVRKNLNKKDVSS